ncbi:hypothetical protein TanjilG_16351 [Lupinus angustifolius]|uniref:Uncharacterized protein n=1 Tax=Lupinus angustifolius TaxID=3871 RepID=A0A1J7HQR7_LUPAN|nr:hypothetical protein TanjilG_16351 [Lupinus angustifolius]
MFHPSVHAAKYTVHLSLHFMPNNIDHQQDQMITSVTNERLHNCLYHHTRAWWSLNHVSQNLIRQNVEMTLMSDK